jgi:hypothetical protein
MPSNSRRRGYSEILARARDGSLVQVRPDPLAPSAKFWLTFEKMADNFGCKIFAWQIRTF